MSRTKRNRGGPLVGDLMLQDGHSMDVCALYPMTPQPGKRQPKVRNKLADKAKRLSRRANR